MNIRSVIELLRPHQYTKNLFVFLPAIFSGNFFNINDVASGIVVFFIFSVTASAMYVFNDIQDREEDAFHPTKKKRPIASKKISVFQAYIIFILLVFCSCICLYLLESFQVFYLIIFYTILNISYSLWLKKIPLYDIATISTGFLTRIFAGGAVMGITVSGSMAILTFLATFFLALGKRRDELIICENFAEAYIPRSSVSGYNIQYIDAALSFLAAITTTVYIVFVIEQKNEYLYISSFFVLLGFLRYLQIAIVENKSGSPSKIFLNDNQTKYLILLWSLSFLISKVV